MKKTLILVRHANALSCCAAGVMTDDLRPLSDEGKKKAVFTANRLSQLNLHPKKILTSPLLRAVQTSAILANALATPVTQVSELNGLLPEKELADFLHKQLADTNTLVAVGHNPNFSYLYPLLCGQTNIFAPGSFAVLQKDGDSPWESIHFGE